MLRIPYKKGRRENGLGGVLALVMVRQVVKG
jgi:hypothetical protein